MSSKGYRLTKSSIDQFKLKANKEKVKQRGEPTTRKPNVAARCFNVVRVWLGRRISILFYKKTPESVLHHTCASFFLVLTDFLERKGNLETVTK